MSQFQKAIRRTYSSKSSLSGRVFVCEKSREEIVWDGEVLVFDLHDHPTAKTCYAWSVDGRVTAVLHEGRVDSPKAAVRMAIAAEHRHGKSPRLLESN